MTTNLILGEAHSLEAHGVRLESRLREMAKGAREGVPKRIKYEEALTEYRTEHGDDEPFPLLETEEAVWERFRNWMFEVVGDVVRQHRVECQATPHQTQRVYSVFALSHSGTLRTALKYLVPEQLPASIDLSPQTSDGSTSNHLIVPNTSVTIIDIVPSRVRDEIWDEERATQTSPQETNDLWRAKLATLTWTEYAREK